MKIRYALMLSVAAATMLSMPVFAQTAAPQTTAPTGQEVDPGHPRVSQVQERITNQENWNQKREEEGKITEKQLQKDDARDQHIEDRLQKDEGEHGGHITKAEDRRLNKSMNSVHREKRRQMRHDRKHRAHPGAAQ